MAGAYLWGLLQPRSEYTGRVNVMPYWSLLRALVGPKIRAQ